MEFPKNETVSISLPLNWKRKKTADIKSVLKENLLSQPHLNLSTSKSSCLLYMKYKHMTGYSC